MELFHTHSRKRSKNEADKLTKKEGPVVNENGECFSENKIDLDGTLFGPCYDPGTDLLRGFDTNVSKMKFCTKKTKKEILKNDIDQEEDVGPEWVDGEPQGTESYIVDGNDGMLKEICLFCIRCKFILHMYMYTYFIYTHTVHAYIHIYIYILTR